MAWTVPTGCYYGALGDREVSNFTYYNAGQSVPNERSPYNLDYGTVLGIRFILVDFVNGYIYTNISSTTTYQIEININTTNKTFTATRLWSGGVAISNDAVVDIIGSNECVSRLKFLLAGDQFNFGNGTGLMGKSTLLGGSSIPYAMRHTFRGRTDITSGVIATGAEWLYYTFCDCSNLQSVSQQTIPTIQCACAVFYGCTSLTTAPTFLSVVANGTADFDQPDWGAYQYARYTSCFYGCSSLTTAPTIPNGVTHLNHCFRGCSSLTTPPAIPSSVTDMGNCFRGCVALTTAPTIPSSVADMECCFDGCSSLTTPPAIPSSVTDIVYCFRGCVSLAGNIVVSNNPSSESFYGGVFYGTTNDIYIVNNNAGSVWKNNIAPSYSNVHYEADDNTVPSVAMSVTRVDSALSEVQTTMGEYAYINAQVQLYEDYLPVGWSNTLKSKTLTKDGTTQTVTWTETEVGLLYTLKCWINLGDIAKHTFTLQVTDRIDDENNIQKASHLSAIVTQVLSKSYKLVDYYHESDQTDPNYDTEGFAIGKYATQANLFDVDMPSRFRDSVIIEKPYYSLDTTASSGTTDGDLYTAITALSWQSDVIV